MQDQDKYEAEMKLVEQEHQINPALLNGDANSVKGRATILDATVATRIDTMLQIIPEFPNVMLAENKEGKRIYVAREGKKHFGYSLKTFMTGTGQLSRRWVRTRMLFNDFQLWVLPEPTTIHLLREAPTKGIHRIG